MSDNLTRRYLGRDLTDKEKEALEQDPEMFFSAFLERMKHPGKFSESFTPYYTDKQLLKLCKEGLRDIRLKTACWRDYEKAQKALSALIDAGY
jgi:hypothetical protein